MKTLKWIAGIILLVGVAGLLWFTLAGFGKNREEIPDQPIPESMKDAPIQRSRNNNRSFQLQDAALVDGFPVTGWVHFTPSGRLRTFRLAEDTVIHGNLIPQNTWVRRLDERNMHLYFFPKNTEIQGYQCYGGAGGVEGTPAIFYSSGRLMSFYSPANIMIQGIPCRRGGGFDVIGVRIHLHENGNLQGCTLSNNAEIDGRFVSAGSEITLSEDGKLTTVNASWKRKTALRIAGIFGQ